MRWLTERSKGHVLQPNNQVRFVIDSQEKSVSVIEALKMKHPSPMLPHSSALLAPDHLPELEDIDITGGHIHHVANWIQGGVGPGGCDSAHWQDALLRYGSASYRLRDCIANLSRCLANSIFDWSLLRALLSSRLIALDKSPGIRPIGVSETLRRVICESICLITRDDPEFVCGSVQLCAGVHSGVEGAIHSASDLFNNDDFGGWTMDAQSAFNSINRISLIWNICVLWPRASIFVFNTYRGWSPLIVRGSDVTIFSRKGGVQGNPLSMFCYAVATIPLIRELDDPSLWRQLWFADDSSVIGDISILKTWLDKLLVIQCVGPHFSYYPEPSKSSLIVKISLMPSAEQLFNVSDVRIVQSGRFLGGVIGDQAGVAFMKSKVCEWLCYVELMYCPLLPSISLNSHTLPWLGHCNQNGSSHKE